MTAAEPSGALLDNRLETVFVEPTCTRTNASDATIKRRRTSDLVPVSIWPQYTLEHAPGRLVVVAPQEPWVMRMMNAIRCRASEKSTRVLSQNLGQAIRVMLRKGLDERKCRSAADAVADDDMSDDADPKERSAAHRNFSGFSFHNVALVELTFANVVVRALNDGRVLVLLLDDDSLRFIRTTLVELIRRLGDKGGAACPEPQLAPFRFDDSTPNIRGKVVWEPTFNTWKLIMPSKLHGKPKSPYEDAEGHSLQVPHTLEASAHAAAKAAAYIRAIAAWNAFNATQRKNIPAPLSIELPQSVSSQSDRGSIPTDDSQERDLQAIEDEDDDDPTIEAMTIGEKWAFDAGGGL